MFNRVQNRRARVMARSKKKESLALAHAECVALTERAKAEIGTHAYMSALRHIVQAWDHLAQSMEYEQRFEGRKISNVESIDVALHYAPLLFASHVLGKLRDLLKSKRRIDRDASDDLAELLEAACARLEDARRIWTYIDRTPGQSEAMVCAALAGSPQRCVPIIRDWCAMGVLRRTDDGGLFLESDMNAFVNAVCPTCGATSRLPKTLLLEPAECEGCRRTEQLVLLAY